MKIKLLLKRLANGQTEDLSLKHPRFTTGCKIQVITHSQNDHDVTIVDEEKSPLTLPYGSRLTYFIMGYQKDQSSTRGLIKYDIAWIHNTTVLSRWDPLIESKQQVVRTIKKWDTIEEMLSCDDEAARLVAAFMEKQCKHHDGYKQFSWPY